MPTTYTDNSYGQMCSHLHRLRLGDYISVLQENGYESWNQLSTVNEKDFDRLGFKLGHRRRLQREIASMKGHPQSEALQPQSSARKIAPQNSYFGTHDLLDLTTPPQVRNTFLLYKKSKKRPLEHSPPPQFEDERNLVVVPSLEKREVVSSDSVRITVSNRP